MQCEKDDQTLAAFEFRMHEVFGIAGRIHRIQGLGLCRVPTIGPRDLLVLVPPTRVLWILEKRSGAEAVGKESRLRHHVHQAWEVGSGLVHGNLVGVVIVSSSLVGVATVGCHGCNDGRSSRKK